MSRSFHRKSQPPRLKLSTTLSPAGDTPKALSQRLSRLLAQSHPDHPSRIHGRRSSPLSFPCHGACTGNAATSASSTPKQPSLVSNATAQGAQLPPARPPNVAPTCLPSLLQQVSLPTRPLPPYWRLRQTHLRSSPRTPSTPLCLPSLCGRESNTILSRRLLRLTPFLRLCGRGRLLRVHFRWSGRLRRPPLRVLWLHRVRQRADISVLEVRGGGEIARLDMMLICSARDCLDFVRFEYAILLRRPGEINNTTISQASIRGTWVHNAKALVDRRK